MAKTNKSSTQKGASDMDEIIGYAAVSERGDFVSDIWSTSHGAVEQIKEISNKSWEDLQEFGISIKVVTKKDIQ